MKKSTAIFLLSFSSFLLSAQPNLEWQKTFGGSKDDKARLVTQTLDGGYIVVGSAASNDGDVSGNHGSGSDIWVLKLDHSGEIEWKKIFGGSGDSDVGRCIQQTSDGGYILGGITNSADGDVSVFYGTSDYWVVKLNALGEIQWEKSLGGSNWDLLSTISQTNDNGYIVLGYTASNDIDVSVNHGGFDMWVVKLNEQGEIQWQKSYGGSLTDYGRVIQQTSDGGYIMAGEIFSNDGDIASGNHSLAQYSDLWLVKLDPFGAIQWEKSIGGSMSDGPNALAITQDGGYVISGTAGSNDGDVSILKGLYDAWVLKLDQVGTIQWEKTIGGTKNDYGVAIGQTSDGSYWMGGQADSNNGDFMSNQGSADWWVAKLSDTGELRWLKSFGGTKEESCRFGKLTNDGGFIMAGATASNDGDVSGNQGLSDFWVVKISPESVNTQNLYSQENEINLSPNPTAHSITVQIPSETGDLTVYIVDLMGRECGRAEIPNGGRLDVALLNQGWYFLMAMDSSGKKYMQKFAKE